MDYTIIFEIGMLVVYLFFINKVDFLAYRVARRARFDSNWQDREIWLWVLNVSFAMIVVAHFYLTATKTWLSSDPKNTWLLFGAVFFYLVFHITRTRRGIKCRPKENSLAENYRRLSFPQRVFTARPRKHSLDIIKT